MLIRLRCGWFIVQNDSFCYGAYITYKTAQNEILLQEIIAVVLETGIYVMNT
jgi:hypothetical protein